MVKALQDVAKFEDALKRFVNVPPSQGEYDAYVSLAYNIGPGAFCSSTLVRKLNAENYAGACACACAEILHWDKFKGQPLPGHTARRRKEFEQCSGK